MYYNRVADQGISNLYQYSEPYLKDKRVLDLGCGVGCYLEKFSTDSMGFDASFENIKRAKEKGLDVTFGDLNLGLDIPEKSFDVIFCSHVLEHVDSPISLLRECNRVLKEDGLIFVSVPNETNIPNVIKLDHYFSNHSEHIYSFSPNNLKVLIKKAGFVTEKLFIDLYLMRKFFDKSPKLALHVLNLIQQMPLILSLPFSEEFMLMAKKVNQII